MKGFKLIIFLLMCHHGWGQEDSEKKVIIAGHTNLIGSYYHLGSYSKERPFGFIEQTIEIIPTKYSQFRFGLGTGFNLYPGTAVVPLFGTFRYVKEITDKWNFTLIQSYGRNIKTGKIGFNSNRYYGDFGAIYHFKPSIGVAFGMGYLMNWDRWGGKSLSFTGSFGLYYKFSRN